MNDMRLERLLDDVLAGIATERVPDLLAPDIATRTSHIGQRARWLALVHQRPLRLPSGLAVGSPTVRLAGVMALMGLLLALVVGGAVVGASLLPSPAVVHGDPPYLTRFCDLASLDEVRAILGDDTATVARGLGRSYATSMDRCVWLSDLPHERFLGVRDWATDRYDGDKVQPYEQDATLTPLTDIGDDAFVLTSPSEADLYFRKGARAAQVFFRPTEGEDPAQMAAIVTQMGRLVSERMSGAPSAVGDLCQLLTPDEIQAALRWTDVGGGLAFATHCDWGGTDPADRTAGYLEVYDVPVEDFDAANALGGDPVPGMGDEAFILATDDQPTLYIRKGNRAAAISTPHYNTRSVHDAAPPYGPEAELTIGQVVADRLSAAPSGTPSTPASKVAPFAFVEWQPLEPTAVFDLPNAGAGPVYPVGQHSLPEIALATDGAVVWAAGAEQLLRIDGATNAAEYLEAPLLDDDTFLLSADDGLWATRWSTDKLYRLDPATGNVELEVEVPGSVHPELVGDQLWVGREGRGDMVPVDRVTGALGDPVPQGADGMGSPDSLWFAGPGDQQPTITRIDPASGDIIATIELPSRPECHDERIGGVFPDAVYGACYLGRDGIWRVFPRIDPATNSIAVMTVLPRTHGAAPVVLDGQVWLVGSFETDDGIAFGGMVRLDPKTGAVLRQVSLGDIQPDIPVAAGEAIWIGDERGNRVLRFDPGTLNGQ